MGAPASATVKNAITFRKTDPVHYLDQAAAFQQVHDRLVANESRLPERRVLSTLRNKIIHLRARGTMPGPRLSRLPLVMSEAFNRHYHQYSNGWFSVAKDLVL